jgi:hypothetical protein
MKKYFQNLFQMLTTTYLVWYRPHALNINKSVVIFDISDMFNKEIEHKEFDLIELENELISKIKIQKKANICIDIQGVSSPIFLN